MTDDFVAGIYDRVDVIYPRFVSTLVQRPVIEQLLPIDADRGHRGHPGQPVPVRAQPRRPSSRRSSRATSRPACSQAVLETKASEESSSRMVAMKNATENAQELIEDLTLSYNKVRQANITREMVEIASGAQAR